jgi:hypothetical protein
MPIIPATQEAEIRRITVQSQPRQIVQKTLSQKNPSQNRADGVAQGVGPEFKPYYCQKKKRKKEAGGRDEGREGGREGGRDRGRSSMCTGNKARDGTPKDPKLPTVQSFVIHCTLRKFQCSYSTTHKVPKL